MNEAKQKLPFQAFYNGKKTLVTAYTSLEAQTEAARFFKVPSNKQWKVSVVRADLPLSPATLPGS